MVHQYNHCHQLKNLSAQVVMHYIIQGRLILNIIFYMN